MRVKEVSGHKALELDADGPLLGDDRSASDLVGEAISQGCQLIIIPVARLDPGFLKLRTGMAGAFIQKLVNYRIRLAVVGDISKQVSASSPLADFVRESNRGNSVWFASDQVELEAQASRRG